MVDRHPTLMARLLLVRDGALVGKRADLLHKASLDPSLQIVG